MLTITACLPQNLPISVQPDDSKVAVASLVGPEEIMLVSLSKSFSALSAEDINDISEDFAERLLLDRALVTLNYQGITDTLETIGDIKGLYASQLEIFEDYQLMELTVFDSTTSSRISAQSVLQPAVEIDSIAINRIDSVFTSFIEVEMAFDDPPNIDNYYVLHIYQFTPPDTTSRDSTTSNSLFFQNNNFLIFERIFTDRGADDAGRIRRSDQIIFTSQVDSALVVLTNIEEGYYNFLEARGRSGSFISSIANEPVNHPTNVDNGVGYFSAHQPRATLVIVEDME
ncbi:MAG: DUF4249 family protein [Balneolaceae bacterium]|nr:DUF4249 family protein [Balneolaceae bacterium]